MPAAARAQNQDTVSTGHPCDATTTIQGTLQTNVYFDQFLAAVQGDVLAPHTYLVGGSCIPHTAYVNEGSPNVFINNIAVARVGDSADQGSIITGSSTVIIN